MKLSGEVAEDLSLIAEKRKEDREEEETFQSRLGARSPSQICAGLWKDADNYSKYHTQAVRTHVFTYFKQAVTYYKTDGVITLPLVRKRTGSSARGNKL